jgi:hypothetical protein
MDTDIDGVAAADPTAFALVWIDARAARILRWRDGVVETRIDSTFRPRAVDRPCRHDPRTRHGGGGRQADAARHRTEHIRRYCNSWRPSFAPGRPG